MANIRRTPTLGRLIVDFTPGPIYVRMLEELEEASIQYGHLVCRGETLTGLQWLERIESTYGANPTVALAITTLMA